MTEVVAQRVAEVRRPLPAEGPLRLQGTSGGGRGGGVRVHLADGPLTLRNEYSPEPLRLGEVPDLRGPTLAHVVGGVVPEGRVFVVTAVEYSFRGPEQGGAGATAGVVVGGHPVLDQTPVVGSLAGIWRGRLVLRPYEEALTRLDLGPRTAGEVVLHGRLQ